MSISDLRVESLFASPSLASPLVGEEEFGLELGPKVLIAISPLQAPRSRISIRGPFEPRLIVPCLRQSV